MVLLTAREHFICHWLLVKRYNQNTKERKKMLFAFHKTKVKNNLGALLGIFLFFLFLIRFVVEFFKENQGNEAVAEALNIGLNNGQILSIPFMIIGVYLFTSSKNRKFIN